MSKIPVEMWRGESDMAMTSALWEYCPSEFGELLDEYERLRNALIEIRDDPTSDIEGTRAYAARVLAGEDH